MVLQGAPSKNITAAGSLSALQPGAPLTPLSTKTVPELNSDESDPQEPSTSKKEIKGPPQAKMDFKTFIRNVRSCFSLSLKVLSGRDCWLTMQLSYAVPRCRSLDQDTFLLNSVFIPRDRDCASGHCQPAQTAQEQAGTGPALLFPSKLWQWPRCSREKHI